MENKKKSYEKEREMLLDLGLGVCLSWNFVVTRSYVLSWAIKILMPSMLNVYAGLVVQHIRSSSGNGCDVVQQLTSMRSLSTQRFSSIYDSSVGSTPSRAKTGWICKHAKLMSLVDSAPFLRGVATRPCLPDLFWGIVFTWPNHRIWDLSILKSGSTFMFYEYHAAAYFVAKCDAVATSQKSYPCHLYLRYYSFRHYSLFKTRDEDRNKDRFKIAHAFS